MFYGEKMAPNCIYDRTWFSQHHDLWPFGHKI